MEPSPPPPVAIDPAAAPAPAPASDPTARRRRRAGPLAAGLLLTAAVAAGLAAAARARPAIAPNALLDRARQAAQAGRLDAARADLDRLAGARAPTPADRLVRAYVASAGERPDDALAELAAVPPGDPLAAVARVAAGQLEARRGRLARAEAAFRAALAAEPRAVQAHRELVYIVSVQQRLEALDAQCATLADLGPIGVPHLLHWSLVRHAEWAAATDLPSLERYVAADPGDRASRLALAEARRRTGRLAEATEALEPLPAADDDARAIRARIALDAGDLAAADRLLADGPADHPALARLRGRAALGRGDAAAAVGWFARARAAQPHDRAGLFGLVTALAAAGRTAEAEPLRAELKRHDALGEALLDVKRRGLHDPATAVQLAESCAALGRHDEARAWLKEALALDPLHRPARVALYRAEQERARSRATPVAAGRVTGPATGPGS